MSFLAFELFVNIFQFAKHNLNFNKVSTYRDTFYEKHVIKLRSIR